MTQSSILEGDQAVPEISIDAYQKLDQWRDQLDQAPKLEKRSVFSRAASDLFLEAEFERDLGAVQAISDAVYVLGRDYAGLSDDAIQFEMDGAKGKIERLSNGHAAPAKGIKNRQFVANEALDDTAPIPNKKALVAFPLVSFENIALDTERRGYLVKGLLVTTGLTVIWGPPKCGKSFWALDLGLHIALGWNYRGHKVQQTTVVYIALEGRYGFPARIEAFRQHHGVNDAPFYLLLTALDLSKQVDALIASIEAQLFDCLTPGVIFIDTLNRSLVGSESRDEDMAKYLAAAGKLEEKFGCLVVIVHHSGIDASRPRGHTSLSGAVESQLKVERAAAGEIVVTVELAKDFEEGAEIVSRLERAELGIDPDGDPISSCIVLPAETTAATRSLRDKGRGPSKSRKALWAAIDEAIDTSGQTIVPRTGMPKVRAVQVNNVRPEFDRRYVVAETDPKKIARAKRVAFARALEHLSPKQFGTGAVDGTDWIWKIC